MVVKFGSLRKKKHFCPHWSLGLKPRFRTDHSYDLLYLPPCNRLASFVTCDLFVITILLHGIFKWTAVIIIWCWNPWRNGCTRFKVMYILITTGIFAMFSCHEKVDSSCHLSLCTYVLRINYIQISKIILEYIPVSRPELLGSAPDLPWPWPR